jgi:hypothetical protein
MNVARDFLRQKSHIKGPQRDFIDQLRKLLVQQRSQKHPQLVVPA